MNEYLNLVLNVLKKCKADLTNEKNAQRQLYEALTAENCTFVREHHLDEHNIPDLFCQNSNIAIEVKIKGQKAAIYKQLVRYSKFNDVKILILCSNKALGIPPSINGKPCYFVHLGKAWL